MPITYKTFDFIVFIFLLPILCVDMLNGVLMQKGIILPISVSQIYKVGILFLFLLRIGMNKRDIRVVGIYFALLLLPTLVRIVKDDFDFSYLFQDILKISKYLTALIAFFYFKAVFTSNDKLSIYLNFNWFCISYVILALNIGVKLIGLGYPMYDTGSIGSKGFFYAGNEISALLLILSSVISFHLWHIKQNKLHYVIFNIINMFVGLLISSKTGILGSFLIFSLIPLQKLEPKLKLKYIKSFFLSILLIIPLVLYGIYKFILNSDILLRFSFFWEKLDFFTFIMSNRNTFVKEMLDIYHYKFSFLEKLIGGGQTYYEELNSNIIEIDFIDIYFAYGLIGISLFVFSILVLYKHSKFLAAVYANRYARLSTFILVLITVLSCMSGHVYNSGIAGVFLGYVLALMFDKQKLQSHEN